MMKKLKHLMPFLVLLLLLLVATVVEAQCPMCRTAVESAMQNEGNKTGAGLNDGILYLLSIPYLAVIITGGIWYYQRKKAQQ